MKFKYFLMTEENKGSRMEPLDIREFQEKLNTEYNISKESGQKFYRGAKNPGISKFYYMNPANHIRNSQYTGNYYMLLMELLPQWSKFPRLSRSIICATEVDNAENWGPKLFRVYPHNSAVMAITVGQPHFWGAFRTTPIGDMESFNGHILDLFDAANVKSPAYDEKDPNVLKKALEKLDKKIKTKKIEIDDYYWMSRIPYVGTNDTLLDAIGKRFNPKAANIKIINTTKKITGNVEMWTEAPCLLEIAKL